MVFGATTWLWNLLSDLLIMGRRANYLSPWASVAASVNHNSDSIQCKESRVEWVRRERCRLTRPSTLSFPVASPATQSCFGHARERVESWGLRGDFSVVLGWSVECSEVASQVVGCMGWCLQLDVLVSVGIQLFLFDQTHTKLCSHSLGLMRSQGSSLNAVLICVTPRLSLIYECWFHWAPTSAASLLG